MTKYSTAMLESGYINLNSVSHAASSIAREMYKSPLITREGMLLLRYDGELSANAKKYGKAVQRDVHSFLQIHACVAGFTKQT